MAGFSEEKRQRLRRLADGAFLQSADPATDAFLRRMAEEGAPLFADTYAGEMRFYNAPRRSDPAAVDVAVLGVPMETSAPVRGGTRLAPRSAREWSMVRGPIHDAWGTIPFELVSLADFGDVGFESPHDVGACIARLAEVYAALRAAAVRPLSLGGVHTMSQGILRGLTGGEPVGLVQIDAHADTARGVFQGSRTSDCSVFLNAVLDESIDPERTIQIGIRGSLSPYWDFSREAGMTVVPMHEAIERGVPGLLAEIRRVIGDGPFYLSLDTDGIDATYLPGTELPEPFGFTSREVLGLVRGLRGLDLIGADIVELCPPYDPHGISANLVAAFGFEMVCLLAEAHVAAHGQRRRTHWR